MWIVYADHGPQDGTALPIIHGFSDSARLWRSQMIPLKDQGYRAVAPDLRGYRCPDRPENMDSELDHWIEDLSRPGALTGALVIYTAERLNELLTDWLAEH